MSQLPDPLLPIAIRGTAQSSPDLPSISPELDRLSAAPDKPEGTLLLRAGMAALQIKSGYRPAAGALSTVPAPAETAGYVSAAAAHLLHQILSGNRSRLLPEWLALAAERHLIVRPEHLPVLIQYGAKQPAERYKIWSLLGRRGIWLADRLDPKIGGWVKVDDPDRQWANTKSVAQKGHLLRLQRQIDPAQGRSLLERQWEQESGAALESYLDLLEPLGPADESLLERGLAHTAGRVRHAAAKRLGELPDSRFVQDRSTSLLPVLTLSGRPGAERLTLDSAQLDRLVEAANWLEIKAAPQSATERHEMNRRAWMLSIVPITTWLDHFEVNGEKLLQWAAAMAEPERSIVTNGLKLSAIRTQHGPLCRAIYWAESKQNRLNMHDRGGLLDSLNRFDNGSILEEMILEQLRVEPRLRRENPALFLLAQKDFPWSPQLIELSFDRLRRYIINSDPREGPTHLHTQLLSHLGERLPVSRFEQEQVAKLLKATEQHGKWRRAVFDLDSLIHFRVKMRAAFNAKAHH